MELAECPETGELRTDLPGLKTKITEIGDPEQILCVFTTTSCFAPRAPDDLIGVAEICKEFDLPMLVNNAYGLQVQQFKLVGNGDVVKKNRFISC